MRLKIVAVEFVLLLVGAHVQSAAARPLFSSVASSPTVLVRVCVCVRKRKQQRVIGWVDLRVDRDLCIRFSAHHHCHQLVLGVSRAGHHSWA